MTELICASRCKIAGDLLFQLDEFLRESDEQSATALSSVFFI